MIGHLRRVLMGFLAIGVALGLAALWVLSPDAARSARFSHDDCRRLDLKDPRTGAAVVGIEDLALAANGDTLILSAHDRLDPTRPDGGLYALNLSTLGSDAPPVLRLDAERAEGDAFRPHGIALDPESGELAVINRVGPGLARVEVGSIGPTGWQPVWTVESERLCRANDLAFRPQGLYVTLDRADCTVSLRDLVPWSRTGAIARLTPDAVLFEDEGLSFPNGISDDAIAETRAKAIRFSDGTRVDLSGGPDNVTQDADGGLVVAVHPGLFRLFLMREGLLSRAGSRIVRVQGRKAPEILFDDPGGGMVSAATVGVLAGGRLIVGSATDEGLLVCETRE